MDLETCPEELTLVDAGDLAYQYRIDCAACGEVWWSTLFDSTYDDEAESFRGVGWHEVARVYADGRVEGAWVCPQCWDEAGSREGRG